MQRAIFLSLAILLILSSCKLKDTVTGSTDNTSATIKVISPNGGESLQEGSAYQITWSGTGTPLVRINYSFDGGSTWSLVKDSLKNTGVYSWSPVPNTKSNLCLIRVSSIDGTTTDQSDNFFAIVKNSSKSLTILAPVGGESWHAGSTQQIKWLSSGIDSVRIEYTVGNNNKWNLIGVDKYNRGIYYWSLNPNTQSGPASIKISDAKDTTVFIQSPATFNILPPPKITVVTPNGKEVWYTGAVKDSIKWTSSFIDNVKIDFTTNNGATWANVVQSTPSTGWYLWNPIPNVNSLQCRVKVSNVINGLPSDTSDANFTITTPGTKLLNVTSPNGGEKWAAGLKQTITWNAVGISDVKIEYSVNSGLNWNTIVATTPSTGFYTWNQVPNTPSTNCLVRITDAATGIVSDVSDNQFSITPATLITIVSPNGGEILFTNSIKTIQYTSQFIPNVKIEYSIDGGATWSTISNSTPATGTYDWTVPNTISSQCRIKVSDALFGDPVAISAANFSITTPSAKAINVTSPNGGEKWTAGSKQTVTWNATGISDVKIEYSINSGLSWITIVTSTPSTGFYTWDQVPNTPSTNCLLKISDVATGTVSDISDKQFSITPAPSITVVSPNGGETLLSGTVKTIQYTSQYVPNVKIDFTTDGGANWSNIVMSTPAIGTYDWTVPNLNSAQCRIKVSDALFGDPTAISSNNFIITNVVIKSIKVLSPNGGEEWEAGTKQNITWSSTAINKVKIELTTDKGSNWSTLVDSVGGGAFEWNIDNTLNSTQCQIRCSDAHDSKISDASDATFTIAPIKSITVTAPVGPHTFMDSDPITIQWQSSGIKTVGIKYTWTNGIAQLPSIPAYTVLVDKIANTGTFTTSFSIPADNQYYVIVYNADDGSNGNPSARSIGNFSIVKTPVGTIQINQPIGGEQWLGNPANVATTDYQNYHPYEIKWNGRNLNKVKIEWSTNGGGMWYTVPGADSTENDGIFVWAPGRLDNPRPDSSDNCRIKISSADKGVKAVDTTRGFFSIHSSKKIRVEFPNNGEDFFPPTVIPPKADIHWPLAFRWTSYAVAYVDIYYSLDNGVSWNILVANYQSTGAYAWDFVWGTFYGFYGPIETRFSTLGRLKIVDHADNKVWDLNDIPFWLNLKKQVQ